jgi:hypothetical protein
LRRFSGREAIGSTNRAAVTENTTTTGAPELSFASTTAGPRESVAAAANDVAKAPHARIIRTRRVGISPG